MNSRGFCPMHQKVINTLTELGAKTVQLDRQIMVIRKDVMAVVADLQAVLVKTTEKLTEAANQLAIADAAVRALVRKRRR